MGSFPRGDVLYGLSCCVARSFGKEDHLGHDIRDFL
jgi:hypothetical protein